jgi:hypothetical protein
METTVTGVFGSAADAQRAAHELAEEGFGGEAIEVITSETEDRHARIGADTSDAVRGATIGASVGGIGMAIGGIAMSVPPLLLFELQPVFAALLFGALGAVAGLVIGLLVGSATGHQVQQEYEHVIENGGVLLAVSTDGARSARAQALLARCGGTMLSSSVHRQHHVQAPQSA